MRRISTLTVLVLAVASYTAHAQSATGIITGTVSDSSGAVVPGVKITVTNQGTGIERNLTSNDAGLYIAPGLEAGQYLVRSEQAGFKTLERAAEVQAGTSTTVNLTLFPGAINEVVNVSTATAEMNYESHSVAGVVEHQEIEELPLNGRGFVQLASLLPGVQVTAQPQGARNGTLGITILGGGGQYPLITMDGLQINSMSDGNAGAGTAINFSQEVVAEFQLSSANFDLSTFTTIQGAVNLVTRSGGNAWRGSAYGFYRDHNMAAYPAFKRSSLNPSPYFVRKNPGVTLGGPLIRDKLFLFGSYEYTKQISAVTVQPDLASIAPSAGIFSSPYAYNYTTFRFDYQPSAKHAGFLRWTNDRNTGYGSSGGVVFPSQWINNYNWSDQFAVGVTSTWTSNLVTEFRFGFRDWVNKEYPPNQSLCKSPCFGGSVAGLASNGIPQLSMVGSSNFGVGNAGLSPQNRTARNYEPQFTVTWERHTHRLKFGYDMDYYNQQFYFPICQSGCMSVYSVETTKSTLQTGANSSTNVATYTPNLPTTVTTTADLLNLPISYPSAALIAGFEAGPGETPGPYDFSKLRGDWRPRVFFQDFWKIRPNLTVNFGLAYAYESGLYASDMPFPGLMGPIFGLAPGTAQPATPPNKTNFSPAFGFSYSPGNSGRWVIRGGAGIYYDTGNYVQKLHSQASLGPVGDGPITLPSVVFHIPTIAEDPSPEWNNIVVQGPGGTFPSLPRGSQVPTAQFTNITLSEFLRIYNAQYPAVNTQLSPSNVLTSGPYQFSNIDLVKQAPVLVTPKMPVPRSYQTSIGVQRDFGHGLVLTADWVRRQVERNSLGQFDLNHYNEFVNGVQTPVIPKCTTAQLFVLTAQCSTGAFSTYVNQGRAIYEGLLLRANKQLTRGYQITVSYAWQNLNSQQVVNFNNWQQGYGPILAHHNLNVSSLIYLPLGFELSANSSFITRTPIEIVTTTIDLSGTGIASSGPLPGLPFRGLPSHAAIADAVTKFNATYAGTHAPNGATIQPYVLPANFDLGRPTVSQDFRLTKAFTYERYKLSIYGEVFNAFNIANLTGYSANLDKQVSSGTQSFAFGQPTQRAAQTFLSSGPRAEQVGVRFNF
jgi:hypothetical protein